MAVGKGMLPWLAALCGGVLLGWMLLAGAAGGDKCGDPGARARMVELYNAGKYGEAIPLAERIAAAIKARLGDGAPAYASALNNLAQLLAKTNRVDEAGPLMRRALAISEKSLGAEHPDVAIGLSNLANSLHDTNRLADAEPLFRRAVAIFEKGSGAGQPSASAV